MELKRFYSTESLSEHIHETPEGFLICEAVPITRIGNFTYKSSEVPVEGNHDGIVNIQRDEADVFAEETMKSFEGKPVTINHPKEFVTPLNWKELAHGHLQNVRRGEGNQSDLMISDLLITSEDAIKLVKAGLREVSCGYDAQYEQIKPGLGKQKEIIGNHLALVVKGRAGGRCAIMDSACKCCGNCMCGEHKNDKEEKSEMKTKKSTAVRDALCRLLPSLKPVFDSVKDEDLEAVTIGAENEGGSDLAAAQAAAAEAKEAAVQAVEAAKEAAEAVANINQPEVPVAEEQVEGDADESDPMAALSAKIDALDMKIQSLIDAITEEEGEESQEEVVNENLEEPVEGDAEEEVDPEAMKEDEVVDEDEEEKEKLENGTTDAMWLDTISRADIISPGLVASKPKATNLKKTILAVKRQALSNGMTKDHASIIKPLLRGKKIASLTEDALDTIFVSASEMIGRINNGRVHKGAMQVKDLSSTNQLADINKKNKEFWSNKRGC